jgi:hypothetical protein
MPGTVPGVAAALLYFTWLLSLTTWGLIWMGYLSPTPAYRLWLSAWVQSLLTGSVSSHHPAQAGTVSDPLSRGCEAPGHAS